MEDIVRVAILDNEIEAELLISTLKEQDIPHIVGSYRDMVYDGIFQTQRGWGFVKAPISYKQRILEIIEDLRNLNAN